MKKRIVKIALGQFASIHGETQQNLNKMLTMTDQAAESGADLIVFPELAYSGYFCTSYQMQQCAEKQDGPFVQALRRIRAFTLLRDILRQGISQEDFTTPVSLLMTMAMS